MPNQPTEIPVNIVDEMENSYIEYAMSVIISRALPDVRDGLKPVHRRVMYTMYEQKNFYNQSFKKSARIVGDVMGKYHPHGDSAIYDTIVRMAQPWAMRYVLVNGQGNFGSIDGDSAAAMRYTEVRMMRISSDILADIEKETVDFAPNYDGSENEPTVLPSRVPNLLVNGSAGIAVGMATNMAPHNLSEVINAALAHIDYQRKLKHGEMEPLSQEELLDLMMEHVKGPDFPTAGFIFGRDGIHQAYLTGRGIVKMRARAIVERNSRNDRESIVVTEIPYQVNKARLIEKIADLVKQKKLDGISDLRDESDREGMRIAIELKRDAVAGVVLNNLYKLTAMQSSFGINNLALVDNQPRQLSLERLVAHFIDHRRDVVSRRSYYELRKAEERAHILEGYIIALDNIDEVIKLIRASKTVQEAREGLMKRFSFSQAQAQAILDMRLQRLTGMERQKVIDELAEVRANIEYLKAILSSEDKLLDVICEELIDIRERYGDDRRTEIIDDPKEFSVEDLIVEEDMVITVSHTDYIKRNAISLYRAQRRGTRGKTGMTTKEEDFVSNLFVASTHDYILVFTTKGNLFWLKVHQIPQGGRASRGKAIVNLINVEKDEGIAAVLPIKEFSEKQFVVFATEQGTVKKTNLVQYSNVRNVGIKAIGLDEDDRIIGVALTDGQKDLILSTRQGKAIRFSESETRPMGRTARGVRGISLAKGDGVVSMAVVNEGSSLLTVTENGFGKRTAIEDYRRQGRGGQGVITIKTTQRNGEVVGVRMVTDDDEIMFTTDGGIILRMKLADVRIIGRNTQGVKLIQLGQGSRVTGIALLAEHDDSRGKETKPLEEETVEQQEMELGPKDEEDEE